MPPLDPTPVLTARGLYKRFKSLVAVDGVSLSVGAGECLALLGPNGAGKTTTVEMLEGLLTPDQGSIEILGLPLTRERTQIMERIGVVLQETQLYKRYTVRETLQLFASFYARAVDPDAIMARLQLIDKAKTQLRHLSGGQKQRVYLGCALINDPELIFLDEPTTGLDPQARRALWDLLSSLKSEGKSMLLTTHYMEEAEVLADRVAIIDRGRIIAEDTPAELIRMHCGDQVLWVAFAGSDEASGALRDRIAAQLPWFAEAQASRGGFEIGGEDMAGKVQSLMAAAQSASLTIAKLEARRSTLEDVFLKLTGRSMRDG